MELSQQKALKYPLFFILLPNLKSLDKTPRKKPSFPDSEGGQQMELEANTSWYGIKADESNHTLRSLFVKDRVLTETEKVNSGDLSKSLNLDKNI